MKNIICACVFICLLFLVASCREQGPVERTGERVDEVIENVAEGDPILKKKGPLEKTGEAVDEALGE